VTFYLDTWHAALLFCQSHRSKFTDTDTGGKPFSAIMHIIRQDKQTHGQLKADKNMKL